MARSCACGSSVLDAMGEKQGMRVARCARCHTIVSLDLPENPEVYARTYQGTEYHWHEGAFANKKESQPDYDARFNHDYDIAKLRLKKLKEFKATGRLLDVGCSNGGFVSAAEDVGGFIAEGYEVNEHIADYARKRGASVIAAPTLQEACYGKESFDVVTLHDVFEHYLNPKRELQELYRVLRPRGLLVIDTPHAVCKLSMEKGLDYHHIKPKEHVFIFSRETLANLVREGGFEVKAVDFPIEGKIVLYAKKLVSG